MKSVHASAAPAVPGRTLATPSPWPGFDEDDIAIVRALQIDGRASLASLGKLSGMSTMRVRHRYEQLTRSGALHTVALIDPGALGRPTVAHLNVTTRLGGLDVARRLITVPGVAWIGVNADYENLLVQVSTADNAGLVALMNDHVRSDPAVAHVTAAIVLRSWSPIFNYAGDAVEAEANAHVERLLWRTGADATLSIDEIDVALLGCLERDARMTITAMSAVTGLSVPATRQRLRRLLATGAARLRSRPNPTSSGVSVVRVVLDVVDDTTAMVAVLSRLPNVSFVSESTAQSALSVEMLCASEQQIADGFARITSVPGVTGARLIRFAEILADSGHW